MNFFKTHLFCLLVIAAAVLFAFPFKESLKADPAVYATIARTVAETNTLWPLHFTQNMFPNFYEHPPLVLWGMAALMKVFGNTAWVAALLSRLCALLSLAILMWLTKRWALDRGESENTATGRACLALLFSLTWVPWIKYVGAAQYEGPLSLLLVLALMLFYFVTFTNRFHAHKARYILVFLFFGLAAFFIKGIITLPIVAFLFVGTFWSSRKKTYFVFASAAFVGWILGAFAMLALDFFFQTQWSHTYWQRILGWGFQADSQFDMKKGLTLSKHFFLAIDFFKAELKYSPLWTPMFWALSLVVVWGWKNKNFRNPQTAVVVLYALFISPFVIATIKMPHWPVPIYPLCALALVQLFPIKFVNIFSSHKALRVYQSLAVILVLFLIVIPLPANSKQKRGEDWIFHKSLLSTVPGSTSVVRVVQEGQPLYMVFAYSAWYLGAKRALDVHPVNQVLATKCIGGDFLWIEPTLSETHTVEISNQGWSLVERQSPGVSVWQCAP